MDYPPSVEKAIADVGGAENVLIVRHAPQPEYDFTTLEAVATERKVTRSRGSSQIVKDGSAGVVCTSMVDDDRRTFQRVLGKYVRKIAG